MRRFILALTFPRKPNWSDRIATNKIDGDAGLITYTQFLNDDGKMEVTVLVRVAVRVAVRVEVRIVAATPILVQSSPLSAHQSTLLS